MMPSDATEAATPLHAALAGYVGRRAALSGMRLSMLVLLRLDLDVRDVEALMHSGVKAFGATGDRVFDACLRGVIADFGLELLFVNDGPGLHHQAMRPRGYDFAAGDVDPAGMEKWRADYRAMAPAQQMTAATILWLYRGKRDFRWLRRVPCDWNAADAVDELERAGALQRWGALVALYPGW
jgi:hypothetical protein